MIDLTDIINDDELGAETLYVTRVSQSINARGRAVNVEDSDVPFVGAVTMDKGAILERVADGEYVTGSIMVTTTYPLRMAGDDNDADIVTRGDNRYTVSTIGDYTRHGFNWAVCVPDGVRGALS